MTEQSTTTASGIAAIKQEYLLQDHVRELNLNFVAAKDRKKVTDGDCKTDSDEPPKKKLKGQNKHRPRNQKAPKSDKLCFKIGTEGSCPFGDSCCYSHDVEAYLSKKPVDLGSTCYLFQKYGKCPYSYSCRFASHHIKDGQNVVQSDIWENYKDQVSFKSVLTKDLQWSLRKRQYNFQKSDEVLKSFIGITTTNKCKNKNDVLPNSASEDIASEKDQKVDSFPVNNGNTKEVETLNLTSDENPDSLVTETELDSTDVNFQDKTNIKINVDDILFERDIKKVDFKNKLFLAPLTTVGNLPFRRICKEYGADITCSEMSMALSLLQGQQSEWALIKRHPSEDIFGIQLCGAHPDLLTRCCQVLSENTSFDFVDINLGCPLDNVYRMGAGSGLMNRMKKLEGIVYGVSAVIDKPLTLKMRTGIYGSDNIAHIAIENIKKWKGSVSLITLHGRSREQRYTRSADWNYIDVCNKLADPIPLFGNGDILSYEDYNSRRAESGVSGVMIARGALIKPWIFKEIKEQTHWDISSNERLEILRNYTNYGLEHWGSDTEGVEKTRRFLLEWLSFLYRYIPVGLLERLPQRINERPSPYRGRDDLETLMASPSCSDWVKISEMLLGPVPENFIFLPKHKANAYK